MVNKVQNGPKAAGCLITSDDVPRLFATASAYGAQLGCGACNAIVGLSIPLLVTKLNLSAATLGQLFMYGGIGYFIGLYTSLKILESGMLFISKIGMSTCSIYITAIAQACMIPAASFNVVKLLIFMTFFGMGGTDNMSSIALSEMWGQRVQPWYAVYTQ